MVDHQSQLELLIGDRQSQLELLIMDRQSQLGLLIVDHLSQLGLLIMDRQSQLGLLIVDCQSQLRLLIVDCQSQLSTVVSPEVPNQRFLQISVINRACHCRELQEDLKMLTLAFNSWEGWIRKEVATIKTIMEGQFVHVARLRSIHEANLIDQFLQSTHIEMAGSQSQPAAKDHLVQGNYPLQTSILKDTSVRPYPEPAPITEGDSVQTEISRPVLCDIIGVFNKQSNTSSQNSSGFDHCLM